MTTMTKPEFDSTHVLGGEVRVPRLGYGAMQLAGPGVIGFPADVDGAIAVLREAVDIGVRFFDTANAYGPRTVNQLIGRALAPFGDDVVVGNKVGATRGPDGSWLTDNRPQTVRTQVEEALVDLQTEASALTYLRLWGDVRSDGVAPVDDVPLEEALGTLVELRDEGKIRHIGLSGATPETLRRAQAITPIAAVQNRFNLIDRSGVEVLAGCEREQIAFVPYFPLATGGLGELTELRQPAARLGASPSSVALAWLLRRSPVIIPIPGTKTLSHVRDNAAATEIAARLTSEEVAALTAVEDETGASLAVMSQRMVQVFQRALAAE